MVNNTDVWPKQFGIHESLNVLSVKMKRFQAANHLKEHLNKNGVQR